MYTIDMNSRKVKDVFDEAEKWIAEREEVKEEVREEYEELRESITALNKTIHKVFSYWETWLRGIVQGVGIAIGSGIVFVILSALLYKIFVYVGLGPEVRGLLPIKNLPTDRIEMQKETQ